MKIVCHFISSMDKKIGEKLGWNPLIVSTIRGMYDGEFPESPIDVSDISDENVTKIAINLSKYRANKAFKDLENKSKGTNISEAMQEVKKKFSIEERNDRLHMIAAMFSYVLDKYRIQYPNLDRKTLCNGYKDRVTGKIIGGQLNIFNSVYDTLLYKRWAYLEEINKLEELKSTNPEATEEANILINDIQNKINKVEDVLENWKVLATFSRAFIKNSESLKLGIWEEFADDATPDNFGENVISELFDPERSTREHWNEMSDYQSSFETVSKTVRKVLATIEMRDSKGRVILDDLDSPKFIMPTKAHKILQGITQTTNNEDEMVEALRDNVVTHPWISEILNLFEREEGGETLKTQFFVDLKTNLQPYGISVLKMEKGIRKMWIKILNKIENNLFNNYLTQIFLNKVYNNKLSIFNNNGNVNWENLQKLRILLDKTKSTGPLNTEKNVLDPNYYSSREEFEEVILIRSSFLKNVFLSLGLSIDSESLRTLSAKPSDYRAIINSLDNIKMYGIEEWLTKKQKEALKNNNYDSSLLSNQNFYDTLFSHTSKSSGKEGVFKENMRKITAIIAKHEKNLKMETRVMVKNSKGKNVSMDSNVAPSYLGDLINDIQVYVDKEDMEGLRKMLEVKYLDSSMFKQDGRILNRWIRDLYYSTADEKEFAKMFSYLRYMGISDSSSYSSNFVNVENITSKQHILSMMSNYFSLRDQKGLDYGNVEYITIKDYSDKLSNWDEKTGKSKIPEGLDAKKTYYIINNEEKESWGYKYINGKWTKIARDDYAWFPVFILGDSGASKNIRARRYSREEILDGLYDIYKSELRRKELHLASIKKLNPQAVNEDGSIDWNKVTTTIENFSNHGIEFSFLPFLNEDFVDIDGSIGKYASLINKDSSKEEVIKVIEMYMNNATLNYERSLDKMGIFELEDKNNPTTFKFFRDEFLSTPNPGDIHSVVEDFYWNIKFATIQQLQMLTISPAFYKNTKDLQKRYKEIHAPGKKLSTRARWKGKLIAGEDAVETCVYFDDISLNGEDIDTQFMNSILLNFASDKEAAAKAIKEDKITSVTSEFTDENDFKNKEAKRHKILKELLGEKYIIYKSYTDNTLTDGQGYRTIDSYRKVMIMAGQWTKEMENAYKEIKQLRDTYYVNGKFTEVSATDKDRIANLAIVFQPIKPYMYTMENLAINDGEKLKIPVQHKYAEAVLIPELLPAGSKLQSLAMWMENHTDKEGNKEPIDLVGSTKIVKVGNFGSTNISDIKDGKSLNEALNKGYVHRLSYGDYRIQTNIPEHVNSSQLFGTQVRKLIMAGVKKFGNYSSYINNKKVRLSDGPSGLTELNGINLISFYNSLIMANMLESYDKFSEEASDIKKLSELLSQAVVNNNRESWDNLMAFALENEEFTIPLFEGALEHDATALIFSIFKKWVNKQTIKGGSAVQVSAMGIEGFDEKESLKCQYDLKDSSNPIYAECEIPWDLNYTDENGRKIDLKFSDWCNADGTLKLGEPLKKDDPRYAMCQSYRNERKEVCLPLIEKYYPNILSILAYRIPTERDYSMINMRVKRFSSKIAGGTIKVPAQFTTIAGFDFDIDKLYFMRKEFKAKVKFGENSLSEDDKNEIFSKIYDDRPYIKSALEEAREEYRVKNNLPKDAKLPSLNSFWDKADITVDKNTLFKEAAEYLGIDISKAYEVDLDSEYDFNKTPNDNNRMARNNMLLDLIQHRLMDSETFEQRYTPGGFANASNAARSMRELLFGELEGIVNNGIVDFNAIHTRAKDKDSDPEPNYDPSDPMTMIIYNQQNQVAGKLIGVFANQNTNHAFSSLMEEFRLSKPISFAGHKYGSRTLRRGEYGKAVALNDESSLLIPPEGVDVDLNVAEFLAASVDAVKDPVLNFLNLNTITADAGAVLARIGYTTEEIGLLFNQPIIKEVCDKAFNEGKNINIALLDVINKYTNNGKNPIVELKEASLSDILSKNSLAMNIVGKRIADKNNVEYAPVGSHNAANQLQVLKLFQSILGVSTEISKFVTATKFTASNAVGSTAGDFYAQRMRVEEYIKSFQRDESNDITVNMKVYEDSKSGPITIPVSNNTTNQTLSNSEYIEKNRKNPLAYEQAMFDIYQRVNKLISKYLPYDKPIYSNSRNRLANLTKSNTLDADTINSIHSEILVYLLSTNPEFAKGQFNGEYKCVFNKNVSNRYYYSELFAKELFELRTSDPRIQSMSLFKAMDFSIDALTNKITVSIQNIGGVESIDKDVLREDWEALLTMDKEGETKYKDLAIKLFMYNFYKLGFGYSHVSFMNLAPTMVKKSIEVLSSEENGGIPLTYVDVLRGILKGDYNISSDDFARQYILNHLDNTIFSYRNSERGFDESIVDKHPDVVTRELDTITIDINDKSNIEDIKKIFILNDPTLGEGELAFKPCIILDGIPYICNNIISDKFNVTNDGVMIYKKVNILGISGISLQYGDFFNSADKTDTTIKSEGSSDLSGSIDDTGKIKSDSTIVDRVVDSLPKSDLASEEQNDALIESLKDALKNGSSNADLIEGLKELLKKTGTPVKDSEGKDTKSCGGNI